MSSRFRATRTARCRIKTATKAVLTPLSQKLLYLIFMLLVAGCGEPRLSKPLAASSDRPNIVVILADDVGVMDVCRYTQFLSTTAQQACYYETPNIDHLASQGALFERAYTPPVCTPSRASLLTGRFGPELGFNNAFGFRNYQHSYFKAGLEPIEGYLPHDRMERGPGAARNRWLGASSASALPSSAEQPTLADYLTGHDSAFIGKWHLASGGIDGFMPDDHGFHEIAVLDEGFSRYFNWRDSWHKPGPITRDYLTDNIGAQAVDWLRSRKDSEQPFFLMLSHFAVHGPYEAKPHDIEYFSQKASRGNHQHTNPAYAAMLKSLDDTVGELVGVLKELDSFDNTLVIFASDNGGQERSRDGAVVTSNAPFRGEKSDLYEGGIRVPMLLSWPAGIAAGQVVSDAVDITDIFATLVEAGQYDSEQYNQYGDGQSLLRLLKMRDGQPRAAYEKSHFFYDPFYRPGFDVTMPLRRTPKSSIVDGHDKLILYYQGYVELFDLSSDPYETNNIASLHYDKVRILTGKIRDWEQSIPRRYRLQENPLYDEQENTRYPHYRVKPEPL